MMISSRKYELWNNHTFFWFALFWCVLFNSSNIFGAMEDLLEGIFSEGLVVDLREPKFCDGVLSTIKGGVITGPDIRIQARKIKYTRKKNEGLPVQVLEAEGEIILEFGNYVILGEKLEYDFIKRQGTVYQGRTGLPPWYFGGERIDFEPSGKILISQGFITTSENCATEWQITSSNTLLTEEKLIQARDVRFHFFGVPLLWLPCLKLDLNSIFDSPVRYGIQSGSLGPRATIAYEIFSWNRFKTFLRLDYRAKRGFGGGIETEYLSEDHKASLETINYIANDLSARNPHEHWRYRFQGFYHNYFEEDRFTMDLMWDKQSDIDMASDYRDRGLELDSAGRTQLLMRKQSDFWISNLTTRVRINPFQTVKQELPTLQTNFLPFQIGQTGIISQNQVRLSYLDFVYANNIPHVHDYNSSRLVFSHQLYRPFHFGEFTATPEIGGLIIYEGNSPEKRPRWVGLGLFACKLDTRLHRHYSYCKHVIKPYIRYEYYTAPTSSPKQHFIFDIDDGWYRLNLFRFGTQQSFYFKEGALIGRNLLVDLYANAFIDSQTIPKPIPKAYGRVVWNITDRLRETIDTAWDFVHNELDHINFRTEWTYNQNLALSCEYRHRSPWDWRKADHSNFFLDAFRSLKELRHSQVSDRRDTLLLHLFYRFQPTWALEFESRHGWNRICERSYNEFDIDFLTTLRSAWNLKFTYRHTEDEDRLAIYISLGLNKPDTSLEDCKIPYVEF
jgi:hypothetical protein